MIALYQTKTGAMRAFVDEMTATEGQPGIFGFAWSRLSLARPSGEWGQDAGGRRW